MNTKIVLPPEVGFDVSVANQKDIYLMEWNVIG